jgi:beta-barrel assembly-enhancing protease
VNDTGSKSKGLLWVGAAIAVAAGAALALPYAAKHVPWRVEQWMAGALGGAPPAQVCTGKSAPQARELLQQLVRRLYPLLDGDAELPITVDVIAGKTVNAYATLGGRIHVFDGLLQQAQSPDELAGVLAHEIEHVRSRHIIQGVAVNLFTLGALKIVLPGNREAEAQIAYLLLTLKFSRQEENEADTRGLARLQAARVDTAGFQKFFTRVAKQASPPEIISNHPASGSRAELAARYSGHRVEPLMDGAAWATLKMICR